MSEVEEYPSPWFGVFRDTEECINLNKIAGFSANFDDFHETAEVTVNFYLDGRAEPIAIRMTNNQYDNLLKRLPSRIEVP